MPNQELFPSWAFCILGTIFHYKSLELWGYRWICGVIVRLLNCYLFLIVFNLLSAFEKPCDLFSRLR